MELKELELTPPRITVLDSGELDNEIYNIFKDQLKNIVSHLPVEVTNFDPELLTLLRAALWMLSVGKSQSTFGQQLLKIKYPKQTSPKKLKILGFILIGSSYLQQRLSSFFHIFQQRPTNDLGFKIVEWAELVVTVLNVVYFIKFLRYGGAANFTEYILGLNPVSTVPSSSRNIGYSYMTRELIWHGLIEFLVLMIPMINYHALKRIFKKYINYGNPKNDGITPELSRGNVRCAICKKEPILPHHMECKHLFCYFCISAHRLADRKFECPLCGYSNADTSAIPLGLDSYKSTSFLPSSSHC